ncbi:hypothetical protein [Streptomyces globisporus]|uniref:hypothetical protein n=2 Tax=Streptomyces globisporus TaxID=1908 RepID=UPI0037A2C727
MPGKVIPMFPKAEPVGYSASGRHVPFRFPATPPRESANPSTSRWEELRQAPQAGWHLMANWIKALLVLIGVCAVIILLDTAGDIFDATVSRMADSVPTTRAGTSAAGKLWGVVDNPIRYYISQHTAGLSASASAVYTFWQLVGWFGLIGGFIGTTGARITWTCWGASSVLAVWSAAPADGRTIATGIAVLRLDHRLHSRPARPQPAPGGQQLHPARPDLPAPDRDPARDPHPRPGPRAR